MRVPLSWLREYVDLRPLAAGARRGADAARPRGAARIEVTGADWTDVVVGRLLSVERHPNADKLWLTSVDAGSGDAAADRVRRRQHLGRRSWCRWRWSARCSPGGRRIERSKIRGVESQGMLCSAIELGLGDDAEGIHILGERRRAARWGADLARSSARWCSTWTSSRTAATPSRWSAWPARWPPWPGGGAHAGGVGRGGSRPAGGGPASAS